MDFTIYFQEAFFTTKKDEILGKTGRFIRRTNDVDFQRLKKRTSHKMFVGEFRSMLDNVHLGCYVEAEENEQYGTVEDVIRDRYGVPVCFRVVYNTEDGNWGYDYIAVSDITFFEPYSYYVNGSEYLDWPDGYSEDEREEDEE